MRCSTRTQGSHSAQRVGLGILQQLSRSGADAGDPLAGQVVELAHEGGVTLVEDGVQDREHGRPLLPCRRAGGGRGCVGPVNKNWVRFRFTFLRSMNPEPELYINPEDAKTEGVSDGQWVTVSTLHGSIRLMAKVDGAQKKGSLRVPHGWWKPETAPGLESGLSESLLYNDGMLFPDVDWNLDREQGLANLRGGIHAKVELID